MTDELEKQFFQCFGIEARQKCAKPLLKNIGGFCKAYKNCVGCDYNDYPQILDRILLELICICNSTYINGYTNYFMATGKTKEELKEEILKKCISLSKDIKHQVRTLFEEK